MKATLFFMSTALAFSMPALASDVPFESGATGHEVDVSFPVTQGRLETEGYTSVAMIDLDPLRVSAFDAQGSEVVLFISPQTGLIDATDHVHAMDQ